MNSVLTRTIRRALKGWLLALVGMVLLLPAGQYTFGQGCAMCYTAAASAKAAAIKALRSGILILLFPPALIFIAIFVVAYRRRNSFNEPVEAADEREMRAVLERLEQVEAPLLPAREFIERGERTAVGIGARQDES